MRIRGERALRSTTTPFGSLVEGPATHACRGEPHGDLVTREGAQLLGGVQYPVDCAADLHEGVAERLAPSRAICWAR